MIKEKTKILRKEQIFYKVGGKRYITEGELAEFMSSEI